MVFSWKGWLTRISFGFRPFLGGVTGLPRQPLFWFSALFLILAILFQIQDPPFRQSIRNLSFDQFQRWHPRTYPAHLPLRVAAIDAASLKKMGRWPWPRKFIAEILERLFELGAAVVVFDMVFVEPDRTSPKTLFDLWSDPPPGLEQILYKLPDSDDLLSKTFSRGVTVTGFVIDLDGDGPPPAQAKVHILEPDGPVKNILTPYKGAISGMNLLNQSAQGVGVMSQGTRQADGLLRRFSTLFQVDGILFPALPLEAVRLFYKQNTLSVRLHPKNKESIWLSDRGIRGIQFGSFFRPLSPEGQLWSHFRPFHKERYISLFDLMQNQVKRQQIEGHIVFIGSTARGLDSRRNTPLNKQMPGIEFHVQLAEQIMNGDYLLRPAWGGIHYRTLFSALSHYE